MLELPIKFRLKSSAGTSPSSIRMLIFHRDFGREGRLVYSTGENILPDLFDPIAGRPEKDPEKLRKLDKDERRRLRLIESRIDDIKTAAREVLALFAFEKKRLEPVAFKKLLNEKLNRNKVKVEEPTPAILITDYVSRYEKEITSGTRLTAKGKVFAPGSIKNYKTCLAQLLKYQTKKKRSLTFDDINQDFYKDFINFLNSKNYAPNTIGKHIARMKKIMRSAKEESLYTGNEHEQEYFKVLEEETEEVYLTADELNAIAEVDLSKSPELEIYRDVFLIGCYIAQRISDYKSIKPEHITKTAKGVPILKLIQKKTGETVMIPFRKELKILLKKYDNHPPAVQDQRLNEAIKIIAEKAKINTLIELEKIKGGKKVRTVLPKHKLIMSHTARRTGATLMYLAGIPTLDIMKITGHKKESNFLKYICVTKEETADNLAQHPYFQ
jgi:integrase